MSRLRAKQETRAQCLTVMKLGRNGTILIMLKPARNGTSNYNTATNKFKNWNIQKFRYFFFLKKKRSLVSDLLWWSPNSCDATASLNIYRPLEMCICFKLFLLHASWHVTGSIPNPKYIYILLYTCFHSCCTSTFTPTALLCFGPFMLSAAIPAEQGSVLNHHHEAPTGTPLDSQSTTGTPPGLCQNKTGTPSENNHQKTRDTTKAPLEHHRETSGQERDHPTQPKHHQNTFENTIQNYSKDTSKTAPKTQTEHRWDTTNNTAKTCIQQHKFKQGSLHYTPEHCLVNGGFPVFWWKKPCFKWAECIF